MMKDRDIIYFSAIDWDYVYARPQQTVSRLAKNNRVLYVEPPYSILSPLKKPKAIKKWGAGLRQHSELNNLHLYSHKPTLPFQGKIEGINPVNQRSIGKKLVKICRKLDFQNPIIFTILPNTVDLLEYFPNSQVIYDCVDAHASFSGHDEDVIWDLEKRLLKRADLVFTTAYALYEDKRVYNDNCHMVPNGAQVEHFAIENLTKSKKEAEKLHPDRIDRKSLEDLGISQELADQLADDEVKIGFVGGIGDWVDLEMVRHAAEQKPNWKFFMIGPMGVDPGSVADMDNVSFPGFMNYKILPQVLQAFHVAICPFKKNELTERVNPVKVYEYLAAGKAVVATDVRELKEFSEYLYLAGDKQKFVSQLEKALKLEGKYHEEGMLPGIRRMRREFAERHSWDERVQRMEKLWETTL